MKKIIITLIPLVAICLFYASPGWAECWDGVRIPSEECEINHPCPIGFGCNSSCKCIANDPDGVTCPDKMWQIHEECDPTLPLSKQRQWCHVTTNMPLNAQLFECKNDCTCYYCGDNHKRIPQEECEPPGSGSDCPGTEICQQDCTCGEPELPNFTGPVTSHPSLRTCGLSGWNQATEECDVPGPLDPPVLDQCKQTYPNAPADTECINCECSFCGDGSWADNWDPNTQTGEQCDESAPIPPNPSIQLQCRLSGTLIQGPLGGCDDCTCIWCGDNTINGTEQCDPGATNNPQGCGICDPNTCRCQFPPGMCGNGTLDPGEECDGTQFDQTVPGNKCVELPDETLSCTPQCTCAKVGKPLRVQCGDGNWFWDFANQTGEQCDASDPSIPIIKQCIESGSIPAGTMTVDCINCQCIVPGDNCGNNVLDPGEECSVSGLMGTPETETDPSGAYKQCPAGQYCEFCMCHEETTGQPECGNFLPDPGEECDADPSQPDFRDRMLEQCGSSDAYCIGCQCSEFPPSDCPDQCCPDCCCPPNCEEQPTPVITGKSCAIIMNGASTPNAWKAVNKWNEKVAEEIPALAGKQIFGESGYSVAQLIVFMDETMVAKAQIAGTIHQGENSIGNYAVMQRTGQPLKDFMKEGTKPSEYIVIPNWIRLAPLTENDFTSVGMSLPKSLNKTVFKSVELPDLSAAYDSSLVGPVTIESILSLDQNAEVQVASDLLWKINNVASVEIKPLTGVAKGVSTPTTGQVAGVLRLIAPPDLASFTGVEGGVKDDPRFYIENRLLAPEELITALKGTFSTPLAEGEDVCKRLLNQPWDDINKYEFTFVQDKLSTTDVTGDEAVKSGAFFFMPTGAAQGAGGCRCDIGAIAPAASQLALMLGFAATGLAGVIVVRRRRK